MTQSRPRPIRIVDIARQAEVSPMAVSNVLHGAGQGRIRVSQETADRIRQVARSLNYRPNLAARQLTAKSSRIIAAIIDTQTNYAMAQVLAGIEQIVSANGYRLMVGYAHDSIERLEAHIDDFYSHGVDGLICMAYGYPYQGSSIEKKLAVFDHCVFLGLPPASGDVSCIELNYDQACEMATSHLLGHQRKRIAFMLPSHVNQPAIERHIDGYLRAHANAGVKAIKPLYRAMSEPMVTNEAQARAALESVLPHQPDALVAGSDESAIWYMKVLSQMGMRVPQDIAIVTLEHWPIGQGVTPALTSVDFQVPVLAKEATELLFTLLREQVPSIRRSARLHLVRGQSCGCQMA